MTWLIGLLVGSIVLVVFVPIVVLLTVGFHGPVCRWEQTEDGSYVLVERYGGCPHGDGFPP